MIILTNMFIRLELYSVVSQTKGNNKWHWISIIEIIPSKGREKKNSQPALWCSKSYQFLLSRCWIVALV